MARISGEPQAAPESESVGYVRRLCVRFPRGFSQFGLFRRGHLARPTASENQDEIRQQDYRKRHGRKKCHGLPPNFDNFDRQHNRMLKQGKNDRAACAADYCSSQQAVPAVDAKAG
jgi:hypothetical protein